MDHDEEATESRGTQYLDRGVSAIEYGIMVLLMAFALAAAAGLVGNAIDGMLTNVANAF